MMEQIKLILLASVSLSAQTTVTPPQLNVTVPDAGQLRILALVGDTFRTVEIGPGISVTATTTGYRIEAASAAPATPPVLVGQRLARLTSGAYGPYAAGMLFRNGIVQTVGQDYNVSGGLFVPILVWSSTDIVVLWKIG